MTSLAYIVSATLPSPAMRERYIAWLKAGHLAEVLKAGALSGMIVQLDEPTEPIVVQTRYIFQSREEYDRYTTEYAPALRAEGLARFGPETGVRFSREIGSVVGQAPICR